MTVERIPVVDRASWLALRGHDVTASVAGCLLGVHEYQTGLGLWALKTGRIKEDPEETAPMQRGRLLEPVAVQLLREMRPTWTITHNSGPDQVYLRDPEIRLGATIDVFAHDPDRGLGIVQIKTVENSVFAQKWRDVESREISPPLWIAVQAITEAHLAEANWAAVAPLTVGFGLDMPIVDVPIHKGIVERVREVTVAFWQMVADGHQPAPDYARDGELIEQLWETDDGSEIDLSRDNFLPALIEERAVIKARGKMDEGRLDQIDAEVKAKLNSHAVGLLADGRRIAWKTQNRKGYTVAPTTFRALRYPRSQKEAST